MSRQSAKEYSTVEVVSMVQRRHWTLPEKVRIVEEASQSWLVGRRNPAPLRRADDTLFRTAADTAISGGSATVAVTALLLL